MRMSDEAVQRTVIATPTVFINGVLVYPPDDGIFSLSLFERLLDEAEKGSK